MSMQVPAELFRLLTADFQVCCETQRFNDSALWRIWCEHRQKITEYFARQTIPSSVQKNDETAKDWKEKGNKLYAAKKFTEAIHCYTQAICCSHKSKEENIVALSYSNRALCLFNLERFDETVDDCTRAIEADYPADKLYKVYHRRGWSYYNVGKLSEALKDFEMGLQIIEQIKEKQKQQVPQDVIASEKQIQTFLERTKKEKNKKQQQRKNVDSKNEQSLKDANPMLAHASGLAKLVTDEQETNKRGRYLIADEAIHIGEEIVKEEAYAAVLLREFEATRCHHCFKEVALLPCESCSHARYCSIQCRNDAQWYHSFECQMAFLLGIPTLALLALRILFKREQEALNVDRKAFWDPIQLQGQLGWKEGQTWKADYDSVFSLQPHFSEMKCEVLASNFFYCALVLHCTEDIFNKFFDREEEENNLEQQQCERDKKRSMVLYLLFRHLCQTQTNVYGMYSVEGEGKATRQSASSSTETIVQRRIAEAVFPTASLLNHSCKQNTILNYNGRTLTLRAAEEIAKGEEITNNYGPHASRMDIAERQAALKDIYFFDCRCASCLSEASTAQLNSLLCVSSDCGGSLASIENGEAYKCTKCGNAVEGAELAKVRRELDLANQFFIRGRELLDKNVNKEGEALRCFQQTLKIRRAKLSPYHKGIAETEDALAETLCRMDNFHEASKHCAASIEILTKFYGEQSMEIGNEWFKLAQLYFNSRQIAKAKEAIQKAEAILISLYGGSHPMLTELAEMKKYLRQA